ncbi:MAG: hypothetical protein K0R05_1683 [Anaerocolumna sp.]|nr:hypothetical protein [Anaerocolumna sp.]
MTTTKFSRQRESIKDYLSTTSIIKVSYGNGSDHFDGNVLPHYHFICRNCSAIEDISMPKEAVEQFLHSADENFAGTIEASSTYFYGLCKKCSENKH